MSSVAISRYHTTNYTPLEQVQSHLALHQLLIMLRVTLRIFHIWCCGPSATGAFQVRRNWLPTGSVQEQLEELGIGLQVGVVLADAVLGYRCKGEV